MFASDALLFEAPIFSAFEVATFAFRGLIDGNQVEIRAICPSTVIENVARNNGQFDINLGPSFGDECTRANNSPTP